MPRRKPDSHPTPDEAAEEARRAEEITRSHEEAPVPGQMAAPEVSADAVEAAAARLADLRRDLKEQMAVAKGDRDAELIDKLTDEIGELESFVKTHRRPELRLVPKPREKVQPAREIKERAPTLKEVSAAIKELEGQLENLAEARLQAIRATDSAALSVNREQIERVKGEISELRATRQKILERTNEFVKQSVERMLAHQRATSEEDRARHAQLAELAETLEEKELAAADLKRWNKLAELDAEQTRKSEDYAALRTDYESLKPEAVAEFMDSIKAEARTGGLGMQHAAEQLTADIEAGRVRGFNKDEAELLRGVGAAEAEFFTTPETVAQAKAQHFEEKRETRLKELAIDSLTKARIASIDQTRQELGSETIPFTGAEFQALVRKVEDLDKKIAARKKERTFWGKIRRVFEGTTPEEKKDKVELKKLSEKYDDYDEVVQMIEQYNESGKGPLAAKFKAAREKRAKEIARNP